MRRSISDIADEVLDLGILSWMLGVELVQGWWTRRKDSIMNSTSISIIAGLEDLPLFSSRSGRPTPSTPEEAFLSLVSDSYETHRTLSKTAIKANLIYIDAECGVPTTAKLTVRYIPDRRVLRLGSLSFALAYLSFTRATPNYIVNLVFWLLRECLDPHKIAITIQPSTLMGESEAPEIRWERVKGAKPAAYSMTEELLRIYLAIEVPRRIQAAREIGGPEAADITEATEVAATLIRDLKDGQLSLASSDSAAQSLLLSQIAGAVAVAAFEPGGVQFVGHLFEALPQQALPLP